MLIEDVIIVQWTGLIISRYLKLIQEKSEKIILREELPRTESDRGGERCSHQDRPDDPRGPRLGEVEVGQAVDTGGGEEVVQLLPQSFQSSFQFHLAFSSVTFRVPK